MRDRHRSLRLFPAGALVWVACAGAGPSLAEDPATEASSEVAGAISTEPAPVDEPVAVAKPVPALPGAGPGLDSLLTLPGDRVYTVERRGGQTRGEWKAKFDRIRADLVAEQRALEEAEQRMDQAAERGAWKVAPPIPGQNTTDQGETTLDFKTRQEIRRHRDEIARLESRFQDLEIEANLASVPEDWR